MCHAVGRIAEWRKAVWKQTYHVVCIVRAFRQIEIKAYRELGMPRLILGVILLGLLRLAHAAPMLASTTWPPYVDEALADGGSLSAVLMPTLQGIAPGLRIAYFPWRRTVMTGLRQEGYVGYFPEYDSPEVRQQCYLSRSIGHSPVGFAYLKKGHFDWKTLDDLKGLQLGTVSGYVNDEAFDDKVARGVLRVDTVSTDMMNVQKLLVHRVDVIVIDRNVFEYLLTRPELRTRRDLLVFHPRLLRQHSLHICFRRTEEGLRLQTAFDQSFQPKARPQGRAAKTP